MTSKSFKNSYVFKRGDTLSTLGIFKTKGNIKHLRLMLMDFNIKDLKANLSEEWVFNAEQATGVKIL